MRLPSRGYYYVLDPPLPVNVLEGNIKGKAKKPIPDLRAEAGRGVPAGPPPSPKDTPESRAGGA